MMTTLLPLLLHGWFGSDADGMVGREIRGSCLLLLLLLLLIMRRQQQQRQQVGGWSAPTRHRQRPLVAPEQIPVSI